MMKTSRRWMLAVLLIPVLAGCQNSPPSAAVSAPVRQAPPPGFPLTVTDDLGRSVTFQAPPRRIVSLAPGHTETLFALGVGDRVIGVDTYSDFPAEARQRPQLNCWPQPPVEQIVALKPDLVLILTQGAEFTRQMETLKIPTLKLFPENYSRATEEITLLGRVLGAGKEAERVTRGMQERAEAVRDTVSGAPPVRAMYEMDALDSARPYVAGGVGFYSELIGMAGGENVFDDVKTTAAQVSAESILKRNPDVILMGDTHSPQQPQTPELLQGRPGWSILNAVKKGRVYAVDSDQITRPGPRLQDGLEAIARCLHPDRF